MRSYRSVGLSCSGTSPLPSLAGVAQTPEAPPVGSGQAGFCGSFVAVKYAGSSGASARGRGAPMHNIIPSTTAKDAKRYIPLPLSMFPPLLFAVLDRLQATWAAIV